MKQLTLLFAVLTLFAALCSPRPANACPA